MTDKFMMSVGKKLFEKHMENYAPKDPLYEEYVDQSGKKKRRRRDLPPGLSPRDEKILKKVKKRAHYLDKGFHICGLRFGWTFFIGLIPVVGDLADAGLSYMVVVRKCRQADIPDWLLRKMLLNNAVSTGLGLVPLVGDVALATYKTNSRNAALFEEFLRIRGEEAMKLNIRRKEDPTVVKPGAGLAKGEKLGDGTSEGAKPVKSAGGTSGTSGTSANATAGGGSAGVSKGKSLMSKMHDSEVNRA